MAMKKGYCIRCKVDEPRRRVFKVNSEAVTCYCPVCMTQYKPKEAIDHYNRFIDGMLKKSDVSLHVAMLPESSYRHYADVLEFEPDNVRALLGRLLSLIYLSTLRRSKFDEVIMLMNNDISRYRLIGSRTDFSNFLRSANAAANYYIETMVRRLTIKGCFYDLDCLSLYYSRIAEIKRFKLTIQDELKRINQEKEAEFLDKSIAKCDKLLEKTYVTADGNSYSLEGFDRQKKPKIKELEKKYQTGLEKYNLSSLEKNDKKRRVIKDSIFRSNKAAYTFIKIGFYGGLALSALGFVLTIVALILNKQPIFYLLLVLGIFFLVSGLVLLALQFIFKGQLKKKRRFFNV